MAELLKTLYGADTVDTFLGLPACADLSATAGQAVLIGVPCCTSYASVGAYCAGAPAAVRVAGGTYAANLRHMNFDLGRETFPRRNACDAGDLPVTDGAGPENRRIVAEAVGKVLAAGGVPVVLGGDDSVPVPVIGAFAGRPIAILQIDAHIDWRDEVQGERQGLSSVMRRASEMPHVGTMVQVGQRGIGSARPSDHADALARGVTFVPAAELHAEGFARAVAAIPDGAAVYVNFDVDALDPAIMPATIGRVAGGLSYAQALGLIRAVAAKARIAGFSMVELMPERDVDGLGAIVAAQLLMAVMGIVAEQQAAGAGAA